MIPVVILDALTGAKAFADLADWRKINVTGRDSLEWLDGLVTAQVTSLRPGRSQRCLLLDDSGGLRADLTVAVQGSSVIVLQDPAQLRPIDDLLSSYTEGYDVELEDRTRRLSIFAFPSRPASPDLGGTSHYAPSALGPGSDLVCMPEDHDRLSRSLQKSFALASADDLEAWRITAGRHRRFDAAADRRRGGADFRARIARRRAVRRGRAGRGTHQRHRHRRRCPGARQGLLGATVRALHHESGRRTRSPRPRVAE